VDKQFDLLQGTLDMLILKAISLGPLHGYGILLRIQQISKDRLERFSRVLSIPRCIAWNTRDGSPVNGASRKTGARRNTIASRRPESADSKARPRSGTGCPK
jgi:hypothetical protein